MIYLDNAATTQIHPEVFDAMLPYLKEEYGNPGTKYELGRNAKLAIDKAREQVAGFFHADSTDQIIFTSGGTESNNLILNDRVFITSNIEHYSILNNVKKMRHEEYPVIPVDEQGVVPTNIIDTIIKYLVYPVNYMKIDLVSVMFSNNEIGSVNNIPKIGKITKNHGVLFHSDCVQAAGCYEIDVNKMELDAASISSHKIHGPKGVGALYIRDNRLLFPSIIGGEHQEYGKRGGTENVAGIVGIGKACELITGNEGKILRRVTNLKQLFWRTFQYKIEKYGMSERLHDNAYSGYSPGKILSFRIDGIDAETMILMLDSQGVCVSAGSACKAHEQVPSRVLTSIGLTDDQARETIRVSFSDMNSIEEVKAAAEIVADTAFRLLEYIDV